MLKYKLLLILLLFAALFIPVPVHAGEVEYTGSAHIFKNDVRSAQKSSLNNALLGGIRKYLQQVAPERKADITNDYLVFVNDYRILRRELNGADVITTVRIDIDDMITEDVATHVTRQINTAVFLITGLPDYIKEEQARRIVSSVFLDNQFTTKDQIPFEQELIDRSNSADVQTAFQSVSSQYLFDIKFTLKNYRGGESCELISDSSYISLGNLSKSIPILRTEVTVEDNDTAQCILTAVRLSTETMLQHTREKLIPTPGVKLELMQYKLCFENADELRTINYIIDTLNKRKYLVKSEMTEFFDDEALFDVSCYFLPSELARKVKDIKLNGIKDVKYDDDSVTIVLDSGADF